MFDVVVVGSGFGGSVAALRLAEKGYRVAVLEAGKRHTPADFPRTNWDVRRSVWYPRLGLRGALRLTLLRHALVLRGMGVGGGSLVYGGVLQVPPPSVWREGSWAGVAEWEREMPAHYTTAKRMLGASPAPASTPSDEVLAMVAGRLGAAATHRPTELGINFAGTPDAGDPRLRVLDRATCTQCGGCFTGCRYGAKNSLDFNYLWLAEQLGVDLHPLRRVTDIAPNPGGGYTITARDPAAAWSRRHQFQARHVVLAAGVLGTSELLLGLQRSGAFPALSQHVGAKVRTNGESVVFATTRRRDIDYSKGPAITSTFHPDEATQVQVMRFAAGSNVFGGLSTLLVDGGGRAPRAWRFVVTALRHPLALLRSLSNWHWSERTVLFLVMRRTEASFRLRGGRRGVRSEADGSDTRSYVPVANAAARTAGEIIGGEGGNLLNEAVLDRPATGHMLGGAVISANPADGVIDPYHRLHGYPDIHVLDGSAVPVNLGVNPALTITALAERAMSYWPARGDQDLRPRQDALNGEG